jgi:3-hydroxymyristoyl/3-hydroxydecanoyl-(acyl carrier protein) dehydratase
MATETRIVIAADHPAIPGHFPDDPLVPGVLLLGHVVAALEAQLGPIRLHGIPQAKFLAPLRPGEPCTIRFPALGADAAQFECRTGTTLVARGALRFHKAGGPSADNQSAVVPEAR